jgi:hypothetical protein
METMMFRKIYWVTEEVDTAGHSEVTGVYTSIHDLVEKGLGNVKERLADSVLRLSLVQLDTPGALGRWTSPGFGSLSEDLDQYLATGEILDHDKESLLNSLSAFSS